MFAGKGRAYPIESPLRCSTLGKTPNLTRKILIRLERPAKDEHSILLREFVNYKNTKFYNIGLRPRNICDDYKKFDNADTCRQRILGAMAVAPL